MFSSSQHHGLIPAAPKRGKGAAWTALLAIVFAHLQIVVTPLPAIAEDDAPQVIIQEVAWAGSSLSLADEWIELANLGSATATIGGWSLKGAGSGDRTLSFPANAEIPPRSTFLIANYAEDHENAALGGPVDLATSTMSISNSALGLELHDASGLAVDRAGDGTEPFAGLSAGWASMIRTDRFNGDRAESWATATSSIGFKPDLPDLGTPGFCDLCTKPEENPNPELRIPSSEAEETATSTEDIPEEPTATSTETMTDDDATTSTEDAAEQVDESAAADETTTSTESVTEDDPVTTSTEPASTDESNENSPESVGADRDPPLQDDDASTQNNDPPQESPTAQTPNDPIPQSSVTIAQSTSQSPSAPPIVFRLNEAVSNPLSGPEWVEIYIEDAGAMETDRELELHDASGKIATIPEGTAFVAPHYLLVVLSSAKLNNGGDELSLRETNGIVIDQTEIPQTYKGEAWARDQNDGAWKIAETLTPGAQNLFPTIIVDAEASTESVGASPSAPSTVLGASGDTLEQENESSTVDESSSSPDDSSDQTSNNPTIQVPDYTDQINEVFTAALASNAQTDQPATAKTNEQTSTSDLTSYPFDDMFDASLNEARVRVTGVVASVPKLLGAAHNFILQNEDGRGLVVYLPAHLNVPPLGSTVAVGGTLKATYKGPELRMKKTDIWKTAATSTAPQPRIVDLLAPGAEDAWSLVAVEGTVIEVKSKSVVLETDDGIEVTVSIPAAVGYNASRLAKKDRVRVTGLLDIGKDAPTIIPRTADEIELLEHAEDTLASAGTEPSRHFPDWVPFAAAGGALLVTGASKRARELLRKRKLQLLMKKAEAVS